jgi:hypothetical protein
MEMSKYGNLANCTKQELDALKTILSCMGVQARITSYHGTTGTYDIQLRNTYRDNCILHGASSVIEAAKLDMSNQW